MSSVYQLLALAILLFAVAVLSVINISSIMSSISLLCIAFALHYLISLHALAHVLQYITLLHYINKLLLHACVCFISLYLIFNTVLPYFDIVLVHFVL